jgi:hypothetical protein
VGRSTDSVEIEFDEDVERALFTSKAWRRHLDRLGFTIVGHAVPHSGVDSGALVQSMGHAVEVGDDGYELILGSGSATGTAEIWYAAPHWAKQRPLLPKPANARSRKRRPHPTKPAPTRPWTKAMQALGIPYIVEPGGFES